MEEIISGEQTLQVQEPETVGETKPAPKRRGYITKSGKRPVKKKPIKRGVPVGAMNTPDPVEKILAQSESPVKKATEPWRPASILVSTHRPGFRSKWCRKDILDKRMAEGWEPRIRGKNDAPETTITDGTPLSQYVTKRNLVLCDMPEELAISRERYFQRMADDSLQSEVNRFKGEINTTENKGSKVYGEIKIS